MIFDNDYYALLQIFPNEIKKKLKNHSRKEELIEIIFDLGRRPEARFLFGTEYLTQDVLEWKDIYYCIQRIGKFNKNKRAGIQRTLHRISCITNQQGIIIGITCRIGRNIIGTISIVRDLLEVQQSLLILGKPGVGKTTLIREISRVLSEEKGKRVIIIDTSNEVAGYNNTPHSGIGKARRILVSSKENQYKLMIEAIENHMPETIVIDEISTELETLAARTIAERGVQLIGTAHANSLENLLKNPTLRDLLGGIIFVTLSDEEARKKKIQKTRIERKTQPTFDVAIELNKKTIWSIYPKVDQSVDDFLEDQEPDREIRIFYTKKKKKIISSFLGLHFFEKKIYPLLWKEKIFNIQKNKNQICTQKDLIQSVFKKKIIWLKKFRAQHVYGAQRKLNVYLFCLEAQKIIEYSFCLSICIFFTNKFSEANIIFTNKYFIKNKILQQKAKRKQIPLVGIYPSFLGQRATALSKLIIETPKFKIK